MTTAAAKPKARILIVDDDPIVRDSLGQWFDSEGYQVETIASGREALGRIEGERWDLALLDIRMPGMDGMELQNRLR